MRAGGSCAVARHIDGEDGEGAADQGDGAIRMAARATPVHLLEAAPEAGQEVVDQHGLERDAPGRRRSRAARRRRARTARRSELPGSGRSARSPPLHKKTLPAPRSRRLPLWRRSLGGNRRRTGLQMSPGRPSFRRSRPRGGPEVVQSVWHATRCPTAACPDRPRPPRGGSPLHRSSRGTYLVPRRALELGKGPGPIGRSGRRAPGSLRCARGRAASRFATGRSCRAGRQESDDPDSTKLTRADSSPPTNRSGGRTRVSGTAVYPLLLRSAMACATASAVLSRPVGTQTTTRLERHIAARYCAPSSTRWGVRFKSSLSLSLAGSPSIAFTTMVPPRPADDATASLTQVGKSPPPRPCSPDASRLAANVLRWWCPSGRTNGPCAWRCPARSRGCPRRWCTPVRADVVASLESTAVIPHA